MDDSLDEDGVVVYFLRGLQESLVVSEKGLSVAVLLVIHVHFGVYVHLR